MLKHFFIPLAVLAFSAAASAQGIGNTDDKSASWNPGEEIVPKSFALSIGPKLGVNFSMASDPDGSNLGVGGTAGFEAGAVANVRFGKRELSRYADTGRFGVQLEALYSLRRLTTDDPNIEFNCYAVPLLFQWWFMPSFCIEAGPTFTGVLSASPDQIKDFNKVYNIGEIKGNDVMLTFGVSYKHRRGFMADVRYNLGNSNLSSSFETKLSTVSVSVGWLFSVVK